MPAGRIRFCTLRSYVRNTKEAVDILSTRSLIQIGEEKACLLSLGRRYKSYAIKKKKTSCQAKSRMQWWSYVCTAQLHRFLFLTVILLHGKKLLRRSERLSSRRTVRNRSYEIVQGGVLSM